MTPEKIEAFKREMSELNKKAMRHGQIAAFTHVKRCIDSIVAKATDDDAVMAALRATLHLAVITAGLTMEDLEPRQ